jgi:hypothetical protein
VAPGAGRAPTGAVCDVFVSPLCRVRGGSRRTAAGGEDCPDGGGFSSSSTVLGRPATHECRWERHFCVPSALCPLRTRQCRCQQHFCVPSARCQLPTRQCRCQQHFCVPSAFVPLRMQQCRWQRRSWVSARWGGAADVVMPGEAAERRALALAARQHGAATTRQLAEAGLGRHRVAHRAAIGWLVRVHRGVFLVGPIHAPLGRAMAAVLSCGEGALLSHHTAGRLWGFLRDAAGAIHVTVRRRGGVHNGRGIRLHRTQALEPADVTYRERIPVTSPARTLLDLAAVLPRAELARAVEEAMVQRLVTPASVAEQFGRYPRHRGVDPLREAVRPESSLTRSEAERRLLELIRSARLPEPRTNTPSPPVRGRPPLAGGTPRRRGRRLRLPRHARRLRARPAPRRRLAGRRLPGAPLDLDADRR